MPTVTVRKGSLCRVITVEIGTTLLSVIRKAGISVSFPCNGKGSCGKCKVKAIGDLSEFLEKESKWISPSEKEAGVRMACYTTVAGDCEIEVIERSTNAVVENAYTAWEGKLDPLYPDGYGVAFDIGTTTVAAQLFSPAEKRPLSAKGELNRQQTYGADVISRIVSCNTDTVEPQSLLIRRQLSEMIKDLCNGAGISFDEVRYLVVCGNTTMMYILCGIEPAPLSVAPFTMAQPFGGLFDIDLPDFEHLPCWIPECASAYVGADITCSVLASGMAHMSGNILLVDAGTNGEMVLASGGGLLCCSTAAGPAFEGAGISCGGNASSGAINSVEYRDGSFSYTTIGEQPADKLCGSGLIDAVAALLNAGYITAKGKLKLPDGGDFFFGDSSVYLSQKDIRQIQLAKAAIRAGMDTLIHAAGLTYEEIETIILCGGFGSYLRPASAEAIGLIPAGFSQKAIAIGNAAGNGAAQILQSSARQQEAIQLVRSMSTVELASSPYFHDQYIAQMMFPVPAQ